MARVLILEGAPDLALLQESLRWVYDRIPLLQATMHSGTFQHCLVWSPNLPTPELEVLPRDSDAAWQRAVVEAVHRKFSDGELLWRTSLLLDEERQYSELIVTFHHSICDGASATLFARWLLLAYEAFRAKRSPEGILPPQHWDTVGRSERSILAEAGAALVLGSRMLQQFFWERQNQHPSRQSVPTMGVDKRRTSPWFFALDQEQCLKLQRRSRHEETTVHGALCAAMLRAAQRQITLVTRNLSCFSNIDLRRHSHASAGESFGCLAYFVVTQHSRINMDSFWDTARDASRRIAKEVRAAGRPPPSWLSPLGDGWLKACMRSASMGRTQDVGISNLGRIELPEVTGDFRVRGMYSLSGQHGVGPYAMLMANTLNERLNMTLSFVDPVTKCDQQAKFTQDFREQLESACSLKDRG